jgi:hypothetical protein
MVKSRVIPLEEVDQNTLRLIDEMTRGATFLLRKIDALESAQYGKIAEQLGLGDFETVKRLGGVFRADPDLVEAWVEFPGKDEELGLAE